MLKDTHGKEITSERIAYLRERAGVSTMSAVEANVPCAARGDDDSKFIGRHCAFCGVPREKHWRRKV